MTEVCRNDKRFVARNGKCVSTTLGTFHNTDAASCLRQASELEASPYRLGKTMLHVNNLAISHFVRGALHIYSPSHVMLSPLDHMVLYSDPLYHSKGRHVIPGTERPIQSFHIKYSRIPTDPKKACSCFAHQSPAVIPFQVTAFSSSGKSVSPATL